MADEKDIITIELRDPSNQLVTMIDHIKTIANIGHSYEVVVDPESSDYKKKFYIDGDGPFHIFSVKKDGKEVKVEKDKLVENYLKRVQK